mgnify:FL=1
MNIVVVEQRSELTMSNTENFESKVDQLILTCQELKRDNLALKKRESALIAEKNQLTKRNDITKRKVENMISRLQALGSVS